MLDFVSIRATSSRKGVVEIYPEFLVKRSKDLMIRGRAFYAIWDEERQIWSQSEYDAIQLIDRMIYEFAGKYETEDKKKLRLLSTFSNRKLTEFQQYCKGLPDNYHELDERIIFANTKVKRTDYVSMRLPYNLSDAPCPAYEQLMSTLYDEDERRKIEWAIGAIIFGDSKYIQKFLVLYGKPGSGKSTVLNIMEKLFEGYWIPFDSASLGMLNNGFALEGFRTNPLVAIQHEGDLSRIENNTRINSIVSHESMIVNEKFKSPYPLQFKTFLILATNKPVRITDAKSGIIRRLIDVSPSGRKVPRTKYDELNNAIPYELGAIASHCLKVYKQYGPTYYDTYIPFSMLGETNDFFNFMEDNYDFWVYDSPDGVTLNEAWMRYKEYCQDANVPYPLKKRLFRSELTNYFESFKERDGQKRNWYSGFRKDKFNYIPLECPPQTDTSEELSWIDFKEQKSIFDETFKDCPAQYANAEEKPRLRWANVKSALRDLDSSNLHYVKVPMNLIVIDFDIKGENGEKSFERNVEAASKWPQTYAELSKSGQGIHLHYYYEGDVEKLSRIFDQDIEVKVSVGDSSLRRKLTKCNAVAIATLTSGLPLKEKKVLDENQVKSEKQLRAMIKKALRKEIHGYTKPEIDFIHYILEKAYNSDLKYDVRDLRPAVQTFALNSSNQAEYCLKTVSKMQFQSEEHLPNVERYDDNLPIIFFDVEVFHNLFVVCWKQHGDGKSIVNMVNPEPSEVEALTKMKLVGFNNRKYDNHILYARMMGYTNEQLFNLSQRIINGEDRSALFGEAYNLSYTDIYDFLSSANKMSLKKWEIKLGIDHVELGLPWDKPVDEALWQKVVQYCGYDVLATEAVWNANQGDLTAREILAYVAGLTVNDTTNQCTTKIILGGDKDAQSFFEYTDLSTIFPGYKFSEYGIPKEEYVPGAKIINGKSLYLGEDPGEGGRVFANPGIYYNVPVLDVASMHPHSAIRLNIFGKYTKRLESLVEARIAIKHKDYDKAKSLLYDILPAGASRERLDEFLSDDSTAKALSNALKTAINSVYGLTSAKFDNKLRDPRNKDNIVAKYGALFMMTLQKEVEKRGFTVVHVKTDSIKIANATPEIISFVTEFGKQYGFTFEHESTYKKICLVNEAVYIAQYESSENCMVMYNYIPEKNQKEGLEWTATGTQFQVPYVFKTLFSKEPIEFKDLCETKSVTTALYLDMNEKLPDVRELEKQRDKLAKKYGQTLTSVQQDELDSLDYRIAKGHAYHFVGKVGLFCPMKPGYDGGILLRENNGKYSSVVGTKKKGSDETYRWLEASTVKTLGYEDGIDMNYYISLANDAIEAIENIGGAGAFDDFVNGNFEPSQFSAEAGWMNVPETDDDSIPFD